MLSADKICVRALKVQTGAFVCKLTVYHGINKIIVNLYNFS
jgi:hypothetical protein